MMFTRRARLPRVLATGLLVPTLGVPISVWHHHSTRHPEDVSHVARTSVCGQRTPQTGVYAHEGDCPLCVTAVGVVSDLPEAAFGFEIPLTPAVRQAYEHTPHLHRTSAISARGPPAI